jgi:hypothetical protein
MGVTRPDGVHWQLSNLSIHDGSIFPTSIGANPQLSIYGIVNRLTQGLGQAPDGEKPDIGLTFGLFDFGVAALGKTPIVPPMVETLNILKASLEAGKGFLRPSVRRRQGFSRVACAVGVGAYSLAGRKPPGTDCSPSARARKP